MTDQHDVLAGVHVQDAAHGRDDAVAASGKEPAAQIRSRLALPTYDENDYS